MTPELPGDPNYPPGVSSSDIDRHFGEPERERCLHCNRYPETGTVCKACKSELEETMESQYGQMKGIK